MPIIAECDCGKKYKVSEKNAGKRGTCSECGGTFLVPGKKKSSAPRKASASRSSSRPTQKRKTKKEDDASLSNFYKIWGASAVVIALILGIGFMLIDSGDSSVPGNSSQAGTDQQNNSSPAGSSEESLAASSATSDSATENETAQTESKEEEVPKYRLLDQTLESITERLGPPKSSKIPDKNSQAKRKRKFIEHEFEDDTYKISVLFIEEDGKSVRADFDTIDNSAISDDEINHLLSVNALRKVDKYNNWDDIDDGEWNFYHKKVYKDEPADEDFDPDDYDVLGKAIGFSKSLSFTTVAFWDKLLEE